MDMIAVAELRLETSVMPVVDILEAESNFQRLFEAIETGKEKEIVIARDGRPVAKLVPVNSPPVGKRIGAAKGKFVIPDTIDADNELIEKLFYGESE
jgi:antitoxin (DNA-binding transcriptional repressor) of toxin-antitoxin stability system